MIELLAVVALICVLIALLLPAVQAAREAARRAQCANNLMQLGIAARSYETSVRVLPPGVVDVSGPVVESPSAYQFGWIARLLPHLEQRNIDRNLNFQTGVYQPANLTARAVTMSVLLCPSQRRGVNSVAYFGGTLGTTSVADPALSSYAACHNDSEAPIDVTNKGVFYLNSRVRSDEIADGLSQTLFFGETKPRGDELGWASGTRATLRNTGTPMNGTTLDPTDVSPLMQISPPPPPGEESPLPPGSPPGPAPPSGRPAPVRVGGFGSDHPLGANFCFGDGSVRFLRSTIDARIFRLLASRADGEPIGDDQF